MNRFIGYRIYIGILLAALAVCGACREETVCNEAAEGETAVIRLEVRAQEQVQVGTRATSEEILNEKENKISNLHVLIYNAEGELIGQKYQATAGTATVNTRSARGCTIYAIANTGDPELFKGYDIHRESTLKDMVRTVPNANTLTNGTTLPMTGCRKNVNITVGINSLGTLELTRMAARIELDIKAKEGSGIKIGSYIICNIPFREYYIVRPMGTEPDREDAPAGSDEPGGDDAGNPDINAHWTNTPEVTVTDGTTSVNKVFYMFENRRGTKGRIEHQKDKNTTTAPKRATYVYVKGKVGEVTVIWRVYLGANNTSNFNIKRNCKYKYEITLNDAAIVDMRVTIEPANVIDLSTSSTANCYLASRTNTWYKFKATVRGNGAATAAEISPTRAPLATNAPINPTDVELVWETNGHKQIIQGLALRDGYVYFKTGPIEEGNAVIAVKDADGNIIWSWHIWKTHFTVEEMPTQTYRTSPRAMNSTKYKPLVSRNLVMMDRHIGAADNTPSNTDAVVKTFGLYYQFGRKDPFPCSKNRERISTDLYSETIDIFDKDGVLLNASTLINNSTYNIRNSDISTDVNDLIVYAIQNPITFIRRDDNDAVTNISNPSVSSGNWIYGAHVGTQALKASNKLWGSDFDDYSSTLIFDSKFTGKTIYDPCPAGWCIPPQDTWTNFTKNTPSEYNDYNIFGSMTGGTAAKRFFNCVEEDCRAWEDGPGKGYMLAPVFGRRFYINGTSGETAFYPATGCRFGKDGLFLGTGFGLYSWSTPFMATSESGSNFISTNEFLFPVGGSTRSYALTVRCVKESSL